MQNEEYLFVRHNIKNAIQQTVNFQQPAKNIGARSCTAADPDMRRDCLTFLYFFQRGFALEAQIGLEFLQGLWTDTLDLYKVINRGK